MGAAVVLYVLWALVFTIWCSLQKNFGYVVISDARLHRWKIERENILIIDLLPKGKKQVADSVLDTLEVSEHELVGLLRWIPPQSTIVFCQRVQIDHFDGRIEEALLRAAIDTVYLLDAREYYLFKGRSRKPAFPGTKRRAAL